MCGRPMKQTCCEVFGIAETVLMAQRQEQQVTVLHPSHPFSITQPAMTPENGHFKGLAPSNVIFQGGRDLQAKTL